ncbi:truncated putative transcriptional regulator [Helicobacter cinaedi CCUG 18818 = ATCC BAA-847]|uniref:Truncated putative transcriptional regulator n=1 Tax=Helicobacter cinaedi CCUG 18818 = ATCC BAA-847 TaxID=537971 RepID=A0AAI8MLQ1_9HELI|nr:WYL domain-containing protein [Helicobacter cinaedi]BAM31546.1 truncated putative transcriptional regulator [Helicobacter cinaedi CCUG 18818 = ATCC BAA-847]
MKKFYLNNIADIKEVRQGESVSEEVLGRLDNALNAWFVPEAKPFMVRLWVDSKVAKYFKRKKISPNQHLDENKDGSLDITLHITSYMEITPLVLMWIPNVVVLEPQELKDFIKKSVEKYLRVLI